MHQQQQEVFVVAETDQVNAEQRTAIERENLGRQFAHQLAQTGRRQPLSVVEFQRHGDCAGNDLHRFAVARCERRAQ